MYYVDVRSEVRTRHYLPTALTQGKKIVVPYCVDGELELFHLQSMEELAVGMYKILEPKAELRGLAEKRVGPDELDLVIVPGVAFDRDGGRLGHGFGYYDKLLQHARPGAPLVALAFECQLFPRIPMQDHDIFMDKIITETPCTPGKDGWPVADATRADVEDTFAEAFRSIYAEVLITARDRPWLDHAVHAATGNASSTILCDCEAGLDRYVGPGGDDERRRPTVGPARSCSSTCRASARTA